MFTSETTSRVTTFLDKHGDSIGYCSLTILEKANGNLYAVIETDLPKYSEYTTWKDIGEANYYYETDVERYKEQFKDF